MFRSSPGATTGVSAHRQAPLRFGIGLALCVWLVQAVLISRNDLTAYTLQHAGVEAVVERHTFDVSGSGTKILKDPGDTFRHNGQLLAAKQPGQFAIAAIPYAVISAFGMTYRSSYNTTAALVTWFSSGLAAASAVLALWLLVSRVFRCSNELATLTALCYGLGSTVTAYAGALHHDVIAASMILWAWLCLELSWIRQPVARLTTACGALAGLTIFTSFLAAPVTASLLVYGTVRQLLSRGTFKTKLCRQALLTLGFAVGVSPLALYNWHYFGAPWLQANVVGHYSDTFFGWDQARFLDKVHVYLGLGPLSIWKFAPLVAAGAFGVAFGPARFYKQRLFIGFATLLHFGYILNIETVGHCQFGPRYSLPLQGLLVVGVAQLFRLSAPVRPLSGLVFAAFYASIVVNFVGGAGGTMYCQIEDNAWLRYLGDMRFVHTLHPLRKPALVALCAVLCVWALRQWSLRRLTPSGACERVS